jgi:hypothetical protein
MEPRHRTLHRLDPEGFHRRGVADRRAGVDLDNPMVMQAPRATSDTDAFLDWCDAGLAWIAGW